MLLYKITYQQKRLVGGVDHPDGKRKEDYSIITFTMWLGSAKEAASMRKLIRQEHGYISNSVKTVRIDVPTGKKELIKFLNKEIVLCQKTEKEIYQPEKGIYLL